MRIISDPDDSDGPGHMTLDKHRKAAIAIGEAVFATDVRGLGACRELLPGDAYARAALAIADRTPSCALILTGFPVGGIGETDGPPGAMAIGQVLGRLGWDVVTVTDDTTYPIVRTLLEDVGPVESVSRSYSSPEDGCDVLRRRYAPDLVIAVERPGRTADGVLVNMRGEDITAVSVPLDALMYADLSVGIGDGGNEIGMGAIAPYLDATGIIPGPCVTRATHLLLATVSNWGAYGLVTMLGIVTGVDELPDGTVEAGWINRIVAAGAVDGITRANIPMVDGHPLDESARVLDGLSSIFYKFR